MQHAAKRKRMPERQSWRARKRQRESEREGIRESANETVRKINMRRVPNIYAIRRPLPIALLRFDN